MLTVENLKLLVNCDDSGKDDLLQLIIDKVTAALLSELDIDCLNKKLETVALDLCVLQYHKVITNGQSSEIAGDITVTANEVGAAVKSII